MNPQRQRRNPMEGGRSASGRTGRGLGAVTAEVLTEALQYFAIVFGAGFALALIRVPFLEPRLGERWAELLEMPLMLAVVAWAALRLVRRRPGWPRSWRLGAGLLGFALMIGAEVLVVLIFSEAASLGTGITERDPVSGSVYLLCLLVFAVAPAVPARRRP